MGDLGQDDQLHMLSQIERAHPISLLVTPANHNALIAFANGLRANPAPIGTLQARILQAIPDLARLYAQDPTLPPLFHVQQLTQAIRQRQQQQGANVQLLIYKLNLACLPWSPPKNRHPLDPNAPGGPTVDFVLAFREVLRRRAPHLTLWVQDTFPVCVTPPLQARAARLGNAEGTPTQRYYDVGRLLDEVMIIALQQAHGAQIVYVENDGLYAQCLSVPVHPINNVNIVDLFVQSIRYNGQTQQDYHPRVTMSSCHVIVRTLCLFRKACYLGLYLNIVPRLLYQDLVVLADVEVATFNEVMRGLAADEGDVVGAIGLASRALRAYVRANGTGTHGGGGGGPRRYAGRQVGGDAGGGCGVSGAAATDRAAEATPTTEDDTLPDHLASFDQFVVVVATSPVPRSPSPLARSPPPIIRSPSPLNHSPPPLDHSPPPLARSPSLPHIPPPPPVAPAPAQGNVAVDASRLGTLFPAAVVARVMARGADLYRDSHGLEQAETRYGRLLPAAVEARLEELAWTRPRTQATHVEGRPSQGRSLPVRGLGNWVGRRKCYAAAMAEVGFRFEQNASYGTQAQRDEIGRRLHACSWWPMMDSKHWTRGMLPTERMFWLCAFEAKAIDLVRVA